MSSDTSMAIIGPDGKVVQMLSNQVSLPTGFVIPEGHTLSWRTFVNGTNATTKIIRFNSVVIMVEPRSQNSVGYHASIECKDAADFAHALDLFADVVGGSVQVRTPISEQSFVFGLLNDLKRLWVKCCSTVRRARRYLGLKIAS